MNVYEAVKSTTEREYIPRMRTAESALAILKEQDPDTAVSLRAIRRLINTGQIPCVAVGRKKLINVDALIAYFK